MARKNGAIISGLQETSTGFEVIMDRPMEKLNIRSANLQDGIDYEVACELVNMRISEKVSELVKNGTYDNPSEADIAELRALAASRP